MRLQDLSPVRQIFVMLTMAVFATTSWAGTETVLANFDGSNGATPYAGLILDKAGNLYGTTYIGGTDNSGTVFELSPSSSGWHETVLHSFHRYGKDGSLPYASLVMDGAGNLYGTTFAGGGHQNECGGGYPGCGTVFELSPTKGQGWRETILYNFPNAKNGLSPAYAMALDKSGNLYSTTFSGGSGACLGGCGVVFKIAHDSKGWRESVIYDFCSVQNCADGSNPDGPVIVDESGNLYGITSTGGNPSCSGGCGIVFRLRPSKGGWKEEVLYSFTGQTDGSFPYGGLVLDQAGNLYGINSGGAHAPGGSIFELKDSTGGRQLKILHNFGINQRGVGPNGPLTFDKSGRLYGTTSYGGVVGKLGNGLVFKLVHSEDGWKENVLLALPSDGHGGSLPNAGVVLDSHGNVYGTATTDGGGGFGTVFEVPR
jgi:uncharacterized repeat protein (TIGR03803 family)